MKIISDIFRTLRNDSPLLILCFILFALPLYRSSLFEDSYNTPKILLLSCSLLLFWGVILRHNILHSELRLRLRPPLFMALFVFWCALSMAWALSPLMGLLPLLCWICYTLFFVGAINVLAKPRSVLFAFGAMTLAALVTSLWTIGEDITSGRLSGIVSRLPDWRGYLSAGVGNSGHIAGIMGYLLPGLVIVYLWVQRRWWTFLIALIILIPSFALTWSVGSAGSALISLFVWMLVLLCDGTAKALYWKRLIPLICAGLIIAAFLLLPHAANHHPLGLWNEAFGSNRWHEGWPTRLAIWGTSWSIIESAPLLGVGCGNFTYAYVQQIVPWLQESPEMQMWAGAYTNDAHNEALQICSELGVVGLCLALGVIVSYIPVLKKVLSKNNSASIRLCGFISAAGLTAFLLDTLMTFPLRLPAHAVWGGLFLAIPYGLLAVITPPNHCDIPWKVRSWGSKCLFLMLIFVLFPLFTVFTLGKRVMAELSFKQGRAIAEAQCVVANNAPVSFWQEANNSVEMAMAALAAGENNDINKHLERAKLFAQQENLLMAADLFQKAASYDMTYSNVLSRLGTWYLMTNEPKQAILAYENASKCLGASEIAMNLGFACYLDGDTTHAQQLWNEVAERRPLYRERAMQLINQSARHPYKDFTHDAK